MKFIGFVWIISISILLTPLKAFPCDELLATFPKKTGKIEYIKRPRYFKFKDLDYGFSLHATLNDKSELSFQIDMVDHEGQIRSELRGRDLFKEMIEHIGAENILVINGLWLEGEDQTNWIMYINNLKQGMSSKDAALNTWTGKRAEEIGFSEIRNIDKTSLFGTPAIFVQFVRP